MPTKSRQTEEVERSLLGALCTGPLTFEGRISTLRSLADYNWIDPDHRIVYEALRRSRHRESAALREHIVAEITRLGFPDIEIEPFFSPCTLTKAEVAGLLDALRPAGPNLAPQK